MTDEVGRDYEITEEDAEEPEGWWNYRLVRKNGMVGIHECFYSPNGKIGACSVDPVDVSLSEEESDPIVYSLREMLSWMDLALDKPILDYESIPEEGAKGL